VTASNHLTLNASSTVVGHINNVNSNAWVNVNKHSTLVSNNSVNNINMNHNHNHNHNRLFWTLLSSSQIVDKLNDLLLYWKRMDKADLSLSIETKPWITIGSNSSSSGTHLGTTGGGTSSAYNLNISNVNVSDGTFQQQRQQQQRPSNYSHPSSSPASKTSTSPPSPTALSHTSSTHSNNHNHINISTSSSSTSNIADHPTYGHASADHNASTSSQLQSRFQPFTHHSISSALELHTDGNINCINGVNSVTAATNTNTHTCISTLPLHPVHHDGKVPCHVSRTVSCIADTSGRSGGGGGGGYNSSSSSSSTNSGGGCGVIGGNNITYISIVVNGHFNNKNSPQSIQFQIDIHKLSKHQHQHQHQLQLQHLMFGSHASNSTNAAISTIWSNINGNANHSNNNNSNNNNNNNSNCNSNSNSHSNAVVHVIEFTKIKGDQTMFFDIVKSISKSVKANFIQ
jgi:hypothetical protein